MRGEQYEASSVERERRGAAEAEKEKRAVARVTRVVECIM